MSTKGCATCEYMRLDADEEPCVRCKHSGNSEATEDNYKPKSPPTNAERIRMMPDEQLISIIKCPYKHLKGFEKPCAIYVNKDKCRCPKCKLEWLKKPAKEGAE